MFWLGLYLGLLFGCMAGMALMSILAVWKGTDD
jgi:hypothetical protein